MSCRLALLVFAGLLTSCGGAGGGGGGGGGGASGWYYHWNCNGDSECLGLNPTGAASGTVGPEAGGESGCNSLMTFGRKFWNIPPATQSCDQSSTGGGGGGGGGGLGGPPTITYATPSGAPGTLISITGANLPTTTTSGVTVTIGGLVATVAQATTFGLNVTVPLLAAGNYSLVVTTSLGSATWGSSFQVVNLHRPLQVVVDATSVYWTEAEPGGSVKKVGLSGGTVTTLATGLASPWGLAQDATSVYWAETSGSAVKKVPKAGGTVVTLASGLTNPTGVAVDATSVYFTDAGLKKVPKTGGAVVTLAATVYDWAVTADASGVYYFGPASQDLTRISSVDGTPTLLSSGHDAGTGIAVDGSNVYWGYQSLHRVPLAGGATVDYSLGSASAPFLAAMASDGAALYVADSLNGVLLSVPVGGGTVTTLATAAGAQLGLAVDATSLYWTDQDAACVRKMPKGGGAVTIIASSPNVP